MKKLVLYYWKDKDGIFHKSKENQAPSDSKVIKRAQHYIPSGMKESYFISKLPNTPPVSSISLS